MRRTRNAVGALPLVGSNPTSTTIVGPGAPRGPARSHPPGTPDHARQVDRPCPGRCLRRILDRRRPCDATAPPGARRRSSARPVKGPCDDRTTGSSGGSCPGRWQRMGATPTGGAGGPTAADLVHRARLPERRRGPRGAMGLPGRVRAPDRIETLDHRRSHRHHRDGVVVRPSPPRAPSRLRERGAALLTVARLGHDGAARALVATACWPRTTSPATIGVAVQERRP